MRGLVRFTFAFLLLGAACSAPRSEAEADATGGATAPAAGGAGGTSAVPAPPDAAAGPEDVAPDRAAPVLPDPFHPVSGTRLTARWFEAAGGVRSFAGWFDTQFDTACEVQTAEDGQLRCVPTGTMPAFAYRDDACTVPMARFDPNPSDPTACPLPGLIMVLVNDEKAGCPHHPRYHRRGDRVTTGDVNYYNNAHHMCGYREPIGDRLFFALGEELPPERFVKFTARATTPAAPLDFTVFDGEDGSLTAGPWRDTASGKTCTMFDQPDGGRRCIASDVITALDTSTYFTNDTCTQPLGTTMLIPCGPSAPEFILARRTRVCPAQTTLYTIGRRAIQVFIDDGTGSCAAAPPATLTYQNYFVPGQPAPIDMLPLIQTTDEPGMDRLRRRVAVGAGGRRQVAAGFQDAVAGEACTPRRMVSGNLRCVPDSAVRTYWYHYADAGCTLPLWDGERGRTCVPMTTLRTATDASELCNPRLQVYRVGSEHVGPVYHKDSSGNRACSMSVADPQRIYHLLTPVPESTFAEVVVK